MPQINHPILNRPQFCFEEPYWGPFTPKAQNGGNTSNWAERFGLNGLWRPLEPMRQPNDVGILLWGPLPCLPCLVRKFAKPGYQSFHPREFGQPLMAQEGFLNYPKPSWLMETLPQSGFNLFVQ